MSEPRGGKATLASCSQPPRRPMLCHHHQPAFAAPTPLFPAAPLVTVTTPGGNPLMSLRSRDWLSISIFKMHLVETGKQKPARPVHVCLS